MFCAISKRLIKMLENEIKLNNSDILWVVEWNLAFASQEFAVKEQRFCSPMTFTSGVLFSNY